MPDDTSTPELSAADLREHALWLKAWQRVMDWCMNIAAGGDAEPSIRIVLPESSDLNTIIVSDMRCGDAYVVTIDPSEPDDEDALESKWYPETVTEVIAGLFEQARESNRRTK